MPIPMSVGATLMLVALMGLWTYFAVWLGPTLWRTNRKAFYGCLFVGGIPYVWLLVDMVFSGRLETHGVTAQVASTAVAGVVAVVGSIIGAIWGAQVGAKATRDATHQAIEADRAAARETEERQRDAVRLLLSLEIDHNLANLQALWTEITRNDPGKYSDDPEKQRRAASRYYANALLRAPFPSWSRAVWEGLTPYLPVACSRAEIARANHVYGGLDTISAIRAQLAEMAAERPYQDVFDSPIQHRPQYHTVYPQTFATTAPDLWERVEKIVRGLLANGNPIEEPKQGATEAAP